MTATGIIVKMGESGMVPIPHQIRQNLKIKDGEYFDIYVTKNGDIVFKKSNPYRNVDWERIMSMVKILIPDQNFAIVDHNGEIKICTSCKMLNDLQQDTPRYQYAIQSIEPHGDVFADLITIRGKVDSSRIKITTDILKEFIENFVV